MQLNETQESKYSRPTRLKIGQCGSTGDKKYSSSSSSSSSGGGGSIIVVV